MKPILLCILDGVGMRDEKKGNAFLLANTPNFDSLYDTYPHTLLQASGSYVGLPDGQMGNSEVGHLNIGSGRVVYQPLAFISKQIEEKTFFQNETFHKMIAEVKQRQSKLHLCGLLSDGGIHSHISHLLALLDLCKQEGMTNVYLHLFTDGRDTLTNVAATYIKKVEEKLAEIGFGSIATISGRYYAMDRDNRWDRVEKAYEAMTEATGEHASSALEAIENNYAQGTTDEFILPTVINENGKIEENDGIIVFNYRPDRLRELFTALTNPTQAGFPCQKIDNLTTATMMPVHENVLASHAFSIEELTDTLGEYLSKLGRSQLRIAETEKYAHVTYFFDGGEEKELPRCDRVLIPSPKVTTYDLSPSMSAREITEELLKRMDQDYDLIVLNFANGDMLGHTGNVEAAIESLETMDECLGKIKTKLDSLGGVLLVTADHGNCELMLDEQDQKITSHTTSLVPFILCKEGVTLKEEGKLADIAPTILMLMDLSIPSVMSGTPLQKEEL